ncbi:13081_t:CDS:2, partial [Racocetra persica]
KAVRELSYELFHDYKQISDAEMKVQLKNKLENNKDSILEIIFNEHYLSAKIDSEVIDIWFQKLLNENNMNIEITYDESHELNENNNNGNNNDENDENLSESYYER